MAKLETEGPEPSERTKAIMKGFHDHTDEKTFEGLAAHIINAIKASGYDITEAEVEETRKQLKKFRADEVKQNTDRMKAYVIAMYGPEKYPRN